MGIGMVLEVGRYGRTMNDKIQSLVHIHVYDLMESVTVYNMSVNKNLKWNFAL